MSKSINTTLTFVAGRMNKTIDERLLANGEYIHAQNVRLGSTEDSEIGSVENAKGNERLTTLTYTDAANTPLSSSARCIGAYEDSASNTIYWMVHDPAFLLGGVTYKLDMIVSYNTMTQALIYHVVSIATGGNTTLNFNPAYLITGISLVDDLFFWTDDFNPPRKINVTRGYPYPTPANVDQITAEELNVIKKPPAESPEVTTAETAGQENFMEGRFICFAYRYRYEDGEYSATSQFSAPAFVPGNFQFSPDAFLNDGMLNINNSATIIFNSGNELVKEVDLLFKEADSNIIKVIERINKDEVGYLDNTVYNYFFDNSKIYTVLPESEILRLYDNVPKKAKAQTLMGNRLVYGNYTEGYDLLDADGQRVNLTYQVEHISTPIEEDDLTPTLSSYTYNNLSGSSPTIPNASLNINTAGINLEAGGVLVVGLKLTHHSFTQAAGTAMPDAPADEVYVNLAFTLPQDYVNGFALATSTAFGANVGTTTVCTPIEYPTCSFSSSWSEVFNCTVPNAHTTPASPAAGSCATCTPVDTLNRFLSGYDFNFTSGQGIQISAVATAPDEFNLIIPAILYIDTNAAPPMATDPLDPCNTGNPLYPFTQAVWQYYEITQADVSYRNISVPRSLHSDRGYEVGIVYMDEYNRSTQSLVSATNTMYVPCSASIDQNVAKITIPTDMKAPAWAKRYKFVMKPDVLGFNTIFSNIVYTATETNYGYVLLEGENAAKVEEGDVLRLKTDIDGAIGTCLEITVLEKKVQPRDFLNIGGTDPGTISQLVPMPGAYMKINNNNFNSVMPEDSYYLPGQKSQTQSSGGECPKIGYPFSEYDATAVQWNPVDLPAGSRVRMDMRWERKGSRQGESACERREAEFEKWFTVSQDYSNAKAWWDGDNIEESVTGDPNVVFDYWYVGAGDCDIANSYNSTLLTPGGGYATLNDAQNAIACEHCTNNFQWWDGGTAAGLYLIVTGTRACAGASYRKKLRSSLRITFEIYKADNVLVFETKPGDALPDVWYEGEASYPIDANGFHLGNIGRYGTANQDQTALVPGIIFSQFFNCYAFGNGVESYRIKDSMKGKTFSLGNRAYSTAGQDAGEADRFADLTYSGVINDESNVNKLNEFNLGLSNFKPLEDSYGEVMKLDGRRTDILVLQQHKISYVLAGKDLLSDAGGGGALTSVPLVLGQQVARIEEYGISDNPESYVQYGPDKFFTDEKRGAVLQLKGSSMENEQLKVISETGMRSWFRDQFIDPTYVGAQKLGGFDPYMNEYVLTINDIDLPLVQPCIGCGLQFSIDMSVTPTWSHCIDVGEVVGDVVITWQVTSPGTWSGVVTYSSVVTPIAPTAVSGSITITKSAPFPTTLTVDGLATVGSPVIDFTVGCPAPETLTVIMVCLTNDWEAGQTIHNQTNFTNNGPPIFTSSLMPADSSSPVTFLSGTDNPLVSQYQVFTGPQGTSGIPLDNSTVYMRTRVIGSDTFVFDNTPPGVDKYYWLRTNTLYNNTPTDISNLMAAIAAAGASAGPLTVDASLAPAQYFASFNSGNVGNYLYLVYDYRDSTEVELCYVAPSGSVSDDIREACCDCFACDTGCTQFNINWTYGPATKIIYVSCAGVPGQGATIFPGTGISICVAPGTTFVVTAGGGISSSVGACNC